MPHGENFLRARQSRDAHTHTPIPSTRPSTPSTPTDTPSTRTCVGDANHWMPPCLLFFTASCPGPTRSPQALYRQFEDGNAQLIAAWRASRRRRQTDAPGHWNCSLAWAKGSRPPSRSSCYGRPWFGFPSPLGMTARQSCLLIRSAPRLAQGRQDQHPLVALAALAALFVVRPSHPSAFACRAVGQCQPDIPSNHPYPGTTDKFLHSGRVPGRVPPNPVSLSCPGLGTSSAVPPPPNMGATQRLSGSFEGMSPPGDATFPQVPSGSWGRCSPSECRQFGGSWARRSGSQPSLALSVSLRSQLAPSHPRPSPLWVGRLLLPLLLRAVYVPEYSLQGPIPRATTARQATDGPCGHPWGTDRETISALCVRPREGGKWEEIWGRGTRYSAIRLPQNSSGPLPEFPILTPLLPVKRPVWSALVCSGRSSPLAGPAPT